MRIVMKTCSLSVVLSAAVLSAQDSYTLDWSALTGGGSTAGSGTGEYTVAASLGQFAAATTAGTGEYRVSGGYWTFTLNEPLDLGITMQLSGGAVSLTWDDSTGVPVQIESSADLQLWIPLNTQPPPFLDSSAQRRFYRLMPVP